METDLFPVSCFHCKAMTLCPSRELTSHSLQHPALPAADGGRQCLLVPAATPGIGKDWKNLTHNFVLWTEANRTPGLGSQSRGDKTRRSCQQWIYRGCGHIGGLSVSQRASEENKAHRAIRQTCRMATNRTAGRSIYCLDSCRLLRLRK